MEKPKLIKREETGPKEERWRRMLFTNPGVSILFWLCVFGLLFFYQQKQQAFHFYYIEQDQLFLWNFTYFISCLMEPAGLARWLTEFCVQYFIQPYYGALIVSAWFTFIGIFTAAIIKRIAPASNIFLLSLLPIILLLYVHPDANYYYKGTVAYMLMLPALYGFFSIKREVIRIVYATVFGILLFWFAGAVAFLFAVCVLIWELLNRFSHAYRFIIPALFVAGLARWSVHAALAGEYRFLLLPDGYFNYHLHAGIVIYFSWFFLPLLLILCRFLRRRKPVGSVRKYIELSLQLLLVLIVLRLSTSKYVSHDAGFYEELDYYMRTEQWDKLINRCEGKEIKNYLYLCCLNVALAEKGALADRMFSFNQRGVQGIYVPWNQTSQLSVLLSDVYFSMGHIALAQRMAFEGNESAPNSLGPRTLKRLVQTNIIYGFYPVAEKYLDLLEQTKYYRKWAHEHRRFLWNDIAVEKDSLLGMKRKCIPAENLLSEVKGLYVDLECIAKQNPAHRASIQYAGALYLLSKDVLTFKEFVEKYYGTDVLPVLPKSFQEAVIILSEQDPSYMERYDIPLSVLQRFANFKKQVLNYKGNTSALPGLLKNGYGDTYWYYYLFK